MNSNIPNFNGNTPNYNVGHSNRGNVRPDCSCEDCEKEMPCNPDVLKNVPNEASGRALVKNAHAARLDSADSLYKMDMENVVNDAESLGLLYSCAEDLKHGYIERGFSEVEAEAMVEATLEAFLTPEI